MRITCMMKMMMLLLLTYPLCWTIHSHKELLLLVQVSWKKNIEMYSLIARRLRVRRNILEMCHHLRSIFYSFVEQFLFYFTFPFAVLEKHIEGSGTHGFINVYNFINILSMQNSCCIKYCDVEIAI